MPSLLPRPDGAPKGFTRIPHRTLDALLCLPLTRRELSVLLLVVRLTYGCRDAPWARLRQADLATIGIGAGHARQVLAGLLACGLLERHGSLPEYRIGHAEGMPEARSAGRAERLDRLVAAHLAGSYRNGNIEGEGVPETGTRMLPKREVPPYRNSNASTVPLWRFDRSQGRFLENKEARIDKDI